MTELVSADEWDPLLRRLGVADAYVRRGYVEASCLLDPGRPVLLHTAGDGGDVVCAFIERDVPGADIFDAARARGQGLILAAPHLGCWELLNFWAPSRAPLSIVYRPPRQPSLEPLLIRARGRLPVEQIRASGAGVRALYRRLAAGGVVGILPDQRPKQGDGVMAPFFGVPALTMVLLSRLARSTGAAVVFAFCERLPRGAGFRLHVLEAPAGIDDENIEVACAALNRGVERCVELAFAQYQWTYKRFPDDAAVPCS